MWIILLVTAAVTGLVGVEIYDRGAAERDVQAFESYCEDRFGEDYMLGVAFGVLGTGGLHCTGPMMGADAEAVYFRDVPPETLAEYRPEAADE